MKLNITAHIIGDDENDKRPLIAGGNIEMVSALGDLKAEVTEGKHKGRIIEAFAWLACDDESATINITEASTGYCLERIQAIAVINGKPCSATNLPDEALWNMTPNFMDAAKKAGFYRFEKANDAEADVLFERINALPKIKTTGSLVA
ncbi:hypothetical protein ACU6TU_08190 [Halomonas sp. LS-001]